MATTVATRVAEIEGALSSFDGVKIRFAHFAQVGAQVMTDLNLIVASQDRDIQQLIKNQAVLVERLERLESR